MAITATLSAFIYVYILPWLFGVRYGMEEALSLHYEEIMIDDLYYEDGTLHIYVRNLSPFKVTIDAVYIEYKGEIIYSTTGLGIDVESNDVVEVIVEVTLEYGKSYNVKVSTKRGIIAERRLVLWG